MPKENQTRNRQHQARDSFFPPKNSDQMLLRKYFQPCCGLRFWAKMDHFGWFFPARYDHFHGALQRRVFSLACFLLYVPSCVSQERSWRRQRTWSNVRGRLDSSRKTTQIFAAFWKKEVFFSCTLPTSLCHFKWPCAPWSQRGPSTVLSSSLGHIRWGLPSRFLFRSTRA